MAADSVTSSAERDVARGHASTRMRSRTRSLDPRGSAELRVMEYLLALGVADEERVVAIAEDVMREVPRDLPDTVVAERAVAAVQGRVDAWRLAVFGDDDAEVHPIWMRTFLGAHPDVFLDDPRSARERVLRFGDPRAGRAPARRTFRAQSLDALVLPRWLKGLLVPVAATVTLTAVLGRELARSGLDLRALVFLGLFAFLTLASAIGATTAIRGFVRGARAREAEPVDAADAVEVVGPLPRTALVMPIYHESPEHVFAALLAMRESLARTPGGDAIEVFVLSDSRDPERIAEEERAFRRTAALGDARVPIYYRRRARNEHQKAGNLAEFFERFGHRYEYAVVLDADSIMHGETIVALVRRMEANPRLGLLQAPLALVGSTTVFARAQQLAASVYGPVFMRGLSAWAGEHGNYYGHNAIVRVRAFLDCCALPRLRGEPPLGGNILSHDFVEAALLCRAGYEVRMATELGGSFEELPQSLTDYVARDRRWCQGNLQHLRIALAEGLRTMSRIHMWIGASAYLAGPAWLAFVTLGALLAHAHTAPLVTPRVAIVLAVSAAGALLVPRALGLIDTLRDRSRRAAHGGALRATASVLAETTLSIVIAPILMLHHARIVASIVLGNAVPWRAQQRRGGSALATTLRSELPTTLLGVAVATGLALRAPGLLPWLAPVYVPWMLAVPLVAAVSNARLGGYVARLGLYAVPTEVEPDELLLRAEELRALTASDSAARFRDLVLDPVLLAAKLDALPDGAKPSAAQLDRLVEKALRAGPAALTEAEQGELLRDVASMKRLHREAWQKWPVESWSQGRERPQLPPERER